MFAFGKIEFVVSVSLCVNMSRLLKYESGTEL